MVVISRARQDGKEWMEWYEDGGEDYSRGRYGGFVSEKRSPWQLGSSLDTDGWYRCDRERDASGRKETEMRQKGYPISTWTHT